MKNRVISIVGLLTAILLAVAESLGVLYNYGTIGLAFYNPIYDVNNEFSWEMIGTNDWSGFLLCSSWYIFLVVPWILYFRKGWRDGSFESTLTGKASFFSVFFTVFNIFLIIGSALLFARPKALDAQGYINNSWLYVLMFFIICLSFVYIPWAIVVIVKRLRRDKRNESETLEYEKNPVRPVNWLVGAFPFIGLAAIVLWFAWPDNTWYNIHEGRICQCKDGKWGYVNRMHREVVPYIYDYASDFRNGRACVGVGDREGRKYGYIDRNGNEVTPFVYDTPADFVDGIAYVTKDGKYGTIGKDGNELIPVIYDYVGFEFIENEGLVMVRRGDSCGFVRTNGDVVIPIVYEDAECYFSNELVRVKLHGQWGYLNRKGDVVIPMIYEEARNFNDGRAEVQLDMEKFYIDVNGRRVKD